jgi:predicted glycosyltransferase involved in capsule biosynthesis
MFDLTDFTFNIPVRVESPDRQKNLSVVMDYLFHHFKTNVVVCEQDKESKVRRFWKPQWNSGGVLILIPQTEDTFHKTKCLNVMARASKTPFLISHDSDVVLDPREYMAAANVMRNNQMDFCYPFNQGLQNIPRKYVDVLERYNNVAAIKQNTYLLHPNPPPGGCFFINKQKFLEGGLEHEGFKGYAAEDVERSLRLQKLGYRVGRLNGTLYHMEHVKITTSSEDHPYVQQNKDEFEKIKNMTPEALKEYVNTWSWKNV